MLRTANNQLQGKLKYVIKDIEGCYPNMPKDAIRTSMKTVLEEMDLKGRKGVFVPRSQNRACTWQAPRSDKGGKWIPSSVLFDIAMFSLDNAIMKLNGDLLHGEVLHTSSREIWRPLRRRNGIRRRHRLRRRRNGIRRRHRIRRRHGIRRRRRRAVPHRVFAGLEQRWGRNALLQGRAVRPRRRPCPQGRRVLLDEEASSRVN